jgi:hypothetical protein
MNRTLLFIIQNLKVSDTADDQGIMEKSECDIQKEKYCGVAPKACSIERPMLINGYASSSGFIGNDCKPTQRPT